MSDEGLPLNMGCVRSDDFYKGTTVKEEDGSSKAQKIEGASGKNELRNLVDFTKSYGVSRIES